MNGLHMVFGSQGAGKSTYARKLAAETRSVYFAIDEWMWALYGPDLPQPPDMGWIMERVGRCEKRIWATAAQVVGSGGSAVLDLGFMKKSNRETFQALAEDEGIIVQWHYVDAPYETRLQRVMERNAAKGQTFSFDVSSAMFDHMEKEFERPTEAERERATLVDTAQ